MAAPDKANYYDPFDSPPPGTKPLTLTGNALPAPERPSFIYRAVVKKVTDGDTVVVNFDLGLDTWSFNKALRLLDVRAPEMVGTDKVQGLAAKAIAMTLMPVGEELIVQTHKDNEDKYGRYLAQIWRKSDGLDINETLRTTAPVGGK